MLNRIGKKLGYKDGGFTIIEVLIVLAVAGLIMAIVLIAIPQLQRNQRNQARRDIIGRMKTEIDAYAGNNNGRVPIDEDDLDAIYTRYFGCGDSATASTPGDDCDVDIDDPQTGDAFRMFVPTDAAAGALNRVVLEGETDAVYGVAAYTVGFSCDGESLTDESGNNRVYAMWANLEGGAVYCIDNR